MQEKISDLTKDEFRSFFNELVAGIPSTYLERVIRDTIRKIEQERETEFDLSKRTHYDDHEHFKTCRRNWDRWMANHDFVSNVRMVYKWFWRAGVVVGATGFFGWLFFRNTIGG